MATLTISVGSGKRMLSLLRTSLSLALKEREFNRADREPLFSGIPSELKPARNLLFGLSQQPLFPAPAGLVRWLKFNLVGGIGILVQLATLALLTHVFRWNYLPATALAVEAAVLHNFLWHERFTWADRSSPNFGQCLARLLRFNLTTGTVSIIGNLAFMHLLVGCIGVPPLAANLTSIAACSLLNFVVNDRLVFRKNSSHSSALSQIGRD
jgi:putative flippase GtrA